MTRQASRQVSFADAEIRMQGVSLDPILQRISDFLDRQGDLLDVVHADLVRGLKCSGTGRLGVSAEQVLRTFVLARVKNWDLRELHERIADGYTLRSFTRFFACTVPNYRTIGRNFNRLRPETVRLLNEAVIDAVLSLQLAEVGMLREDTTVVETDIHFPTDSSLLWDVVRIETRLMRAIREELGSGLHCEFSDRTRRARRRAQEISRMTGRAHRTRQHARKYRDLLQVAEEVLEQAAAHARAARGLLAGLDPMRAALIGGMASEIERYSRLGHQVVDQSRRRVFGGEQLPVDEKLFSIFEPHTDLIVRGKARTPVEFGHKVRLVECRGGLITDYEVLKGNPPDQDHVVPTLQYHQRRFGATPEMLATDRGFDSAANIAACKDAGVIDCIPQRGGQKTPERQAYESSRAFKKGQRFRAGIEGRISVLLRGRGMSRCLSCGRERFEVFVGMAVLANNLLAVARLLASKTRRRAA
jgi:IS5 family transposase